MCTWQRLWTLKTILVDKRAAEPALLTCSARSSAAIQLLWGVTYRSAQRTAPRLLRCGTHDQHCQYSQGKGGSVDLTTQKQETDTLPRAKEAGGECEKSSFCLFPSFPRTTATDLRRRMLSNSPPNYSDWYGSRICFQQTWYMEIVEVQSGMKWQVIARDNFLEFVSRKRFFTFFFLCTKGQTAEWLSLSDSIFTDKKDIKAWDLPQITDRHHAGCVRPGVMQLQSANCSHTDSEILPLLKRNTLLFLLFLHCIYFWIVALMQMDHSDTCHLPVLG